MHASWSAPSMASALAVNGTSVSWLVDRQGNTVWSTSPANSTFAHLGSLAGVPFQEVLAFATKHG